MKTSLTGIKPTGTPHLGNYLGAIRPALELVDEFRYICPASLTPDQVDDLNWLAAATFRVMGCRDVARVDFRLDAHNDNKPYILEINPLPGLNPGYSDLCIEAEAYGWSYEQLINTILDQTIERFELREKRDPHLSKPSFDERVMA